jgi:hypothetical protein
VFSWAPVTHACNPSYSGSSDQEDYGLKPAWANISRDLILKMPNTKQDWWNGSRCRPWVQAPALQKKKKKKFGEALESLLGIHGWPCWDITRPICAAAGLHWPALGNLSPPSRLPLPLGSGLCFGRICKELLAVPLIPSVCLKRKAKWAVFYSFSQQDNFFLDSF